MATDRKLLRTVLISRPVTSGVRRGDTHAGGKDHFRRGKRLLTAEAVPETGGKGVHLAFIGKRFDGHKLIIATEGGRPSPSAAFGYGGHALQQLIANVMAQIVILFKLIKIDGENGKAAGVIR